MTATFRLRQDAVEWRRLDGEIVALDLRRSLYLSINRTGVALWEALAQGATNRRLEEILVAEHRIDRQTAARDVDAFLADLREQELLVEAA